MWLQALHCLPAGCLRGLCLLAVPMAGRTHFLCCLNFGSESLSSFIVDACAEAQSPCCHIPLHSSIWASMLVLASCSDSTAMILWSPSQASLALFTWTQITYVSFCFLVIQSNRPRSLSGHTWPVQGSLGFGCTVSC